MASRLQWTSAVLAPPGRPFPTLAVWILSSLAFLMICARVGHFLVPTLRPKSRAVGHPAHQQRSSPPVAGTCPPCCEGTDTSALITACAHSAGRPGHWDTLAVPQRASPRQRPPRGPAEGPPLTPPQDGHNRVQSPAWLGPSAGQDQGKSPTRDPRSPAAVALSLHPGTPLAEGAQQGWAGQARLDLHSPGTLDTTAPRSASVGPLQS